jgi:cell wall-associated NlpC family hydrolase
VPLTEEVPVSDPHRITIEYKQGSLAARESYYHQIDFSSSAGITNFGALLNAMLAKRANMMYDSHQFVSVAIASEVNRASAWLLKPGRRSWPDKNGPEINIPIKGTMATSPSSPDGRADMMQVSLIAEFTFDFGHRKSRRYIASHPDGVTSFDDNIVVRNDNPSWWSAWDAFAAGLALNQWAVKAKVRTGVNAVTDVSSLVVSAAAPAQVGVLLPTGLAPSQWNRGTKVDLANFRPGRGQCPCPSINGRWTLDSRNDTLTPGYSIFYLRGSEGIDPTVYKHLGTVQGVGFDYFPIMAAEIVGATVHKRGGGSRRRGRSKIRCCGR